MVTRLVQSLVPLALVEILQHLVGARYKCYRSNKSICVRYIRIDYTQGYVPIKLTSLYHVAGYFCGWKFWERLKRLLQRILWF